MKLLWLLTTLLLLVLLLYVIAGIIAKKIVAIALEREQSLGRNFCHKRLPPEIYEQWPDLAQQELFEKEQGEAFWLQGTAVFVTSDDGLQLKGQQFVNDPQRWVVAVHGYRSDGKQDMAYVGYRYAQAGYSVLIPDLRGHGESAGEQIGMGWLDRLDLLAWLRWLTAEQPQAQIILHGGSMGAAAVLMASGEKLPANVQLLIADSGFTSAYGQCRQMLVNVLKLPAFPLLGLVDRYARKTAGYSFRQASAIKRVASNHLPLLVIHGGRDTLVPLAFGQQIQAATAGPKEFLEIEAAGHLMGMTFEPRLYWQTIFSFINFYQK